MEHTHCFFPLALFQLFVHTDIFKKIIIIYSLLVIKNGEVILLSH